MILSLTYSLSQVTMLSTCHNSEMVELPPSKTTGEPRRKPRVIVDYNNGKKGVDVSDQLAATYPTPRKTVKWYHKVFYNICDMVTVNAYAVHKALGGTQDQLHFRLELILQLLGRPAPAGARSRFVFSVFCFSVFDIFTFFYIL